LAEIIARGNNTLLVVVGRKLLAGGRAPLCCLSSPALGSFFETKLWLLEFSVGSLRGEVFYSHTRHKIQLLDVCAQEFSGVRLYYPC